MAKSPTHRRQRPRERSDAGILPDDLYDYLLDEGASARSDPGRGRRTVAVPGILPDDLYDYYTAEPVPRRSPTPKSDTGAWLVVDDWPEKVPITEAEIAVFEHWFADVLDELFGPTLPESVFTSLSSDDNSRP